jgi:hypothetical protein
MSLYNELASTTTEMLTEFGQQVIVTNFESGVEDSATGIATQNSSTFTTVGLLLDYDYRNFGDSSDQYLQTSRTDKRILVAATQIINTGDLLFIDNTIYKAYVVKVVNPAGTRVLYDIWAQR